MKCITVEDKKYYTQNITEVYTDIDYCVLKIRIYLGSTEKWTKIYLLFLRLQTLLPPTRPIFNRLRSEIISYISNNINDIIENLILKFPTVFSHLSERLN